MQIEDALNLLDDLFDNSWSLPLSGGKNVIDIEQARNILDTIRISLPEEFQRAEDLLHERDTILSKANQEAEAVIRKAEERARVLLAQDEAVKAAQQKANDILTQAYSQAKEMRYATHQFSDNILRQTEESLYHSLEELKATRQALRSNAKQLE